MLIQLLLLKTNYLSKNQVRQREKLSALPKKEADFMENCIGCFKNMCCDPKEDGQPCPVWSNLKETDPFRACFRCINFCECLPLIQKNKTGTEQAS